MARAPETTAATPQSAAAGDSLARCARDIVAACDPVEKVARAKAVSHAWGRGTLTLTVMSAPLDMPERPGRPPRPLLMPPRSMPKRSTGGLKGRFALLHSLAHIELNAVDMTWDLIGRFTRESMPKAFFDDWVQVGLEEACHFELVSQRLNELGGFYGELDAHDGLWQAAQATAHDLLARLAIVPLVLEARGLDVVPSMIDNLRHAGDERSADVLEVIYRDEKRHVATGMRWFLHQCAKLRQAPEPTFQALVRAHFRGSVKPPFNDRARAEAGLTPGFYKPLSAFGAAR
jgi:uncharacterized ferritin-like protein (DUF455 family)